MRIGILDYRFNYYSVVRNIIDKVPDAEYIPVSDIFSRRRKWALRLNRLLRRPLIFTFNLNNQFMDLELNNVDILHFSNGISYGRTPWVAQFETLVPRFAHILQRHNPKTVHNKSKEKLTQRGLKALASPYCKRIIAMSENAALHQRQFLAEYPPNVSDLISPKICVLHPPQKLLVDKVEPRTYDTNNPIRFILVGAGFFRKGGREILNVFKKLVSFEHFPIKLVLVSRLTRDSFAAHETEEDIAWAKETIDNNKDFIEYYEQLPNEDVLSLLKACDIGLLPTYADTYGYFALESQAAGCPVISTDVRALPEINNPDVGWLINVPKTELGEAFYQTPEDRAVLSERIQSGLEHIIRSIVEDPTVIAKKGQAALEKIAQQHDPVRYGEALRDIYNQALL